MLPAGFVRMNAESHALMLAFKVGRGRELLTPQFDVDA